MLNETNVAKNFKDKVLDDPIYGKIIRGLKNENINYHKHNIDLKSLKCYKDIEQSSLFVNTIIKKK